MPVSEYYTKLKDLWDELETYQTLLICNQMKAHNEQKEEDRMMQFLMGLNDTYNGARSNILMMTPLPNVRQASSLVIQDETQRQMALGSTENFSIAAAIQNRSHNFSNHSKHCAHCDRNGHTIEECRTLKFYCPYCDKNGHTEDRCKFKNGTWVSNSTGPQNNRHHQGHRGNPQQQKPGSNRSQRGSFHAINAADATQGQIPPKVDHGF
ncbi:hypothetical protein L3X38_028250 [Prunus dulcis]|uniref:CCHC-type domain-containing protein n=1 Tax=Prunus dulcis TaxID=3755 RepID=A0AAD4Z1W1_PRUDU|nr:hypothetical protein L3X38_028250 [Prunus dulcis]